MQELGSECDMFGSCGVAFKLRMLSSGLVFAVDCWGAPSWAFVDPSQAVQSSGIALGRMSPTFSRPRSSL